MNNQATMRRSRGTASKPTAGPSESIPALSAYGERLSALAERIRGTNDISAIIGMLNQALVETRQLRTGEDELATAQRKVAEAERSIESMRNELEHVKAMLHQDPLTGALNRRGIDDAFRQEASRSDRHGTRLCVVIIDLDDFKELNDTLGHQSGDRALVHVTSVVGGSLRPTDRIGRLGGEEFLVMLPDAGLDEAATVMARIQRELAAQPLHENAVRLNVTFSAGIAERAPREDLERLVARADAALYDAKRSGKNRIVAAR